MAFVALRFDTDAAHAERWSDALIDAGALSVDISDPAAGTPREAPVYGEPGGPGIRVDSHVYQNYLVPPYYDSLIGKVIAFGDTREQAIARMRIALSEMVVEGIRTNIPLHQELMVDEKFVRGGTSIHYLEEKLAKRA